MIETKGLVGAPEAAAAVVKAANVQIEGYRTLRNRQVPVIVRGDVCAVDAGRTAAIQVGDPFCGHIVTHLHGETESIVDQAVAAITLAEYRRQLEPLRAAACSPSDGCGPACPTRSDMGTAARPHPRTPERQESMRSTRRQTGWSRRRRARPTVSVSPVTAIRIASPRRRPRPPRSLSVMSA
jgi:ethanolamine utilization protein EutM